MTRTCESCKIEYPDAVSVPLTNDRSSTIGIEYCPKCGDEIA